MWFSNPAFKRLVYVKDVLMVAKYYHDKICERKISLSFPDDSSFSEKLFVHWLNCLQMKISTKNSAFLKQIYKYPLGILTFSAP